MADNLTTQTTVSTPPSGSVIAARQVTYSGDSSYIAPVGLVTFSGADDAKSATDVPAGGGTEAASLRVTIANDSTGLVSIDDNGGSLTVDGTVAVSAVTSITNVVHVDDNAGSLTVDGTVGITANSSVNVNQLAGTTTDTNSGNKSAGTLRVVLATDQPALTNKLLVTPDSVALPANQSVNVNQIAGNAVAAGNGATSTGTQRVTVSNDSTGILAGVTTVTTLTGGGVAHDGVDSGNPVKVGLKAKSSPKGFTLVSDADRVDATADLDSILMVKLNTSGADIISERVSNTDGASTAFSNFSAVASTKNYITGITCYRTDAGTSVAYVDFRDGTAGSILWSMPLPPNGGSTEAWATPAFKTSANTALAFDVSAALTTVYISVTGFQSKV